MFTVTETKTCGFCPAAGQATPAWPMGLNAALGRAFAALSAMAGPRRPAWLNFTPAPRGPPSPRPAALRRSRLAADPQQPAGTRAAVQPPPPPVPRPQARPRPIGVGAGAAAPPLGVLPLPRAAGGGAVRGAVAGHGHGAGEGGGSEPQRCLQPSRQAAGYGAGSGTAAGGGRAGGPSARACWGQLVRGGQVR